MAVLKDVKRIVVKVGTSTLTYNTGKTNIRRMHKLVSVLSDIVNSGIEVALVFLIGTVGWFTYQMITYPILPGKYLAVVLLALYLVSILLGLSQYKGNLFVNILGKIGIIILSAALFFVNLRAKK